MNKRWRNAGLYALLVLVVIALATAIFDGSGTETQTWRYSKFLDAIQNNQIERVSISSDRARARFTDPAGNGQIIVNLAQPTPSWSAPWSRTTSTIRGAASERRQRCWCGPSAPC